MTNLNNPDFQKESHTNFEKEKVLNYLKEHGDILSRIGMDEDMQDSILKLIEQSDENKQNQSQVGKQQELISQLKSQNEGYRRQLSENNKSELGNTEGSTSDKQIEKLSYMVEYLTTAMQEFSRSNVTSGQDQQERNKSLQKDLKNFNEIAYGLNSNTRYIAELSDKITILNRNMNDIQKIAQNIEYIKELANGMHYIKELSYKMR